MIFVDLDNFKLVNDSYGHDAGDRLLVDVAARLRGAVRDTDLVARTGGDEFVIFARPVAGDDEALAVAARAHDAIQAPLDIAGSQRQMTVSVGVSCLSCEDAAITEAMARADAALYRAKADGRGRVQLADANVLSEARRRMDVERALEECAPGDFDLHYQPIVDLTDGAIVAVEALLRWTHPQMGRMAPDEFIPIAESSGRIIDIGRWVLDRACRDAVRWDALRGRPTRVFVNISACQLTDPEFADTVMDALASSGACGSHLALEVTETPAIEGGVPASTLAALQAAGVDLALDDFGTGFSSLAHLARFPISILKLDRMFLDTASHDPDGVAILDTVVHLARGLKVTSLAEGVETELQLAEIRARGFQLAQGYFFSRPQPSTELDAILQLDRPYRALMTGSEPAARLVP